MSWVQVECSNGSRYSAPSHGRPLPNLRGAAELFQAPLSLRRLQTFDLVEASNGVVAASSNYNDGVRMSIVADQRDLGGHLGITTVTVGDEQGDVEETLVGASSDHTTEASLTLQRLLERVFAILLNTNDHGVSVLLDAVCTRRPLPLTAEAIARAITVAEDDGGLHVSPAVRQARAHLPCNPDALRSAGQATNQKFLQRLTQRADPSASQEYTAPLQLLPANKMMLALSPKEEVRAPPSLRLIPSRPLSFATAVRRQAFLFFVRYNVVPLSLLSSRVEHFVVSGKHAKKGTAPLAAEGVTFNGADDCGAVARVATLNPTDVASPSELLSRLVERVVRTPPKAVLPTPQTFLSCHSLLNKRSSSTLGKSATWTAIAKTAEESSRMLLLIVFRLLVSQPLMHADTVALERVLLHELWTAEETTHLLASPCAPVMMAAFSPSGLLLSSASFRRCFHQEEYLLLSAAAIDRLTRAAPSATLSSFSTTDSPRRPADALRWTSWPMRVGSTLSALLIVDVLLLTVGDALAIYLCFPRPPHGTTSLFPSLPPSVAAALSLEAVQRHLERILAGAADRTSLTTQRGAPPQLSTSLLDALVHACTHATAPFTPAFHDALFTVNAVEHAMSHIRLCGNGNNNDKRPFFELARASSSVVNEAVARELLQLLHRGEEQPNRDVSSPHLSAPQQPPQSPANPSPPTAMNTAAPAPSTTTTKPRAALHKLFASLPLPNKRSGSRGGASTSAKQDHTEASLKQSYAHIQQQEGPQQRATSKPDPLPEEHEPWTARVAAALLALPLECMLCCVAALITRNELGALRRVHEMGLHSFFFLHDPPMKASLGKYGGGEDEMRAGAQTAVAASPIAGTATSPRFGVNFSRLCLQQSQCPRGILPDEWVDVEGVRDGEGGRLTFIEDPTLTLALRMQPSDDSCGHKTPSPSSAAVTVLPCWSILHAAPIEPPRPPSDAATAGAKEEDIDPLSESLSSEADEATPPFCPTNMREDAQLLTSLSYVLPHRRGRREVAAAKQQEKKGALAAAGVAGSDATAAGLATTTTSSTATSEEGRIVAVVNISGDIAGERTNVLLSALRKHGVSKSEEAKMESSSTMKLTPADSGAVEVEYAAGVCGKMKELCGEVLLCQEAALVLLENAFCNL